MTTPDHKKPEDLPEMEIIHLSITEATDDVPPPPRGLIPQFNTVQEWLAHLCRTEQPGPAIIAYSFGLFQSADGYTVSLVGSEEYHKDGYGVIRIHFQPTSGYYRLPPGAYKNSTYEQVVECLADQLMEFTRTDIFKESFFARAKVLTTDFKGEIWPK